jgi:murein DD-endopeptidase MepM/ murein hydrolase activator NlpD
VTLATAVALGSAGAGAQSGGDKRQQLQDEIGEATAAESAALAQLDTIRQQRFAIEARVAEIDAQLAAADAKLAPLEAEVARLAAEMETTLARLREVQAELDEAQAKLDASAAQLYRSARRGVTYDNVFVSRPRELITQSKYLDHVAEDRTELLERVRDLRDEVEEQRQHLEAQQAKADAAEAEAQAVRDQIAALRAEVEPARAQLAAQVQAEEAALADIQSRKAQFQAELAAMQAASDSIAARLRSGTGYPGQAGGCQARPVPGGISSGFGMRYHPVLGYNRMHTGVDMRASSGDPIHACRAGVVVIAGSQGGYGNTVVIDHGGGMATLYAHQSRIAVSVGQIVNAGDVIGYVGSTGMSTGPHLHFEVRLSGNPVDPVPYLPLP